MCDKPSGTFSINELAEGHVAKPVIAAWQKWVLEKEDNLRELMNSLDTGEERLLFHAFWILSAISMRHAHRLAPYLEVLVGLINVSRHNNAIKRMGMKILSNSVPFLNEDLHAVCLATAYDILLNQNEAIAPRCFAMGVIDEMCRIYPELRKEFIQSIELIAQQEEIGAAMRSRIKRYIKVKR